MTPEERLNNALKSIRWLVMDVDGVLTDGKLYFDNSGNELKTFNSLDGHGIKMLQNPVCMWPLLPADAAVWWSAAPTTLASAN